MLIKQLATIEVETHVAPCLDCGSTDIRLSDNNNSSFNMGGGTCKTCGHETYANTGCLPKIADLARIWNAGNDIPFLILQEQKKIADATAEIAALTAKENAANVKFGMTRERLMKESVAMGMGKTETQNAMQTLYEHGYISYPFTDCKYLPATLVNDVQATIDAIALVAPDLNAGITIDAKSPIFNDDLLTNHHAIIPRARNNLWASSLEPVAPFPREIYALIANSYLEAISAPALQS